MQTNRLYFLLAFFFISVVNSQAQSTVPNSREPEKKMVHYAPWHSKTKKFKKAKVTNTARYEFYVRVEKAAREKQKILKKLAKPQFSDRRYFGHKRVPKRHKSSKMRYCDECGIRH